MCALGSLKRVRLEDSDSISARTVRIFLEKNVLSHHGRHRSGGRLTSLYHTGSAAAELCGCGAVLSGYPCAAICIPERMRSCYASIPQCGACQRQSVRILLSSFLETVDVVVVKVCVGVCFWPGPSAANLECDMRELASRGMLRDAVVLLLCEGRPATLKPDLVVGQ